ncbi:MAG TPA: methicillin resistance protein [Planctomycetaceae bacterium]|nr:methicillin resistance protein [Planctomycetaceae bacterium]
MVGKKSAVGKQELMVVRCVEECEPVDSATVVQRLQSETGKARTTILTMLDRLRAKGLLKRRKVQGRFQYSVASAGKRLEQELVEDFVSGSLGGSAAPFLAYMSQKSEFSEEEMTELRRLVARLAEQEVECD